MALLVAAALIPGLLAPADPGRDPGFAPFEPIARPGSEVASGEGGVLSEPRGSEADPARTIPAGAPAPATWKPMLRIALVDERARPVAGDFRLEYRRLARRAGGARARADVSGPEFAVDVSELGSYGVWLRGSGYVGEAVVVARLGGDEPAVRVELQRAVRIGGSILDARGEPLADVGVHALIRREGAVVARLEAVSDAAGSFALEIPPRTTARVFVGDASRPWVPPIDVDAALGPRELDPVRVELFAAEFVVVRADGTAAAGARLDGTGLSGGSFGVTADDEGRARVDRLSRGRWRVNAALAGHGRESRAVELPLAKDEPVLLVLPR